MIFEKFRKFKLFANLKKYFFDLNKIDYLKYLINFYKRFINEFNNIDAFLSDILKKSNKEKFFENFEISLTTKKAFCSLKNVFFVASVLLHFNFKRKIRFKTNTSKFEIFDIINQLIEFTNQ